MPRPSKLSTIVLTVACAAAGSAAGFPAAQAAEHGPAQVQAQSAEVPQPPRDVTTAPDFGPSIKVSWQAVFEPLLMYRVTATNVVTGQVVARQEVLAASNAVNFAGLPLGADYRFEVVAYNHAGESAAVAAPELTRMAPSSPVVAQPTVLAGGRVKVTWTPPEQNSWPVENYEVQVGDAAPVLFPGDARSAALRHVATHERLPVTVRAHTAGGLSDSTTRWVRFILPGSPGGPFVHVSGKDVVVSWKPGEIDLVPVNGYRITGGPGGPVWVSAPTTRHVFRNVADPYSRSFRVEARSHDLPRLDSPGVGSKATAPARPQTKRPGRVAKPTVTLSKNRRTVTVRWKAPTANGAPITKYTITSSRGKKVVVSAKRRTVVIRGLASGVHTFTVTAHNQRGASKASVKSVKVRVRR